MFNLTKNKINKLNNLWLSTFIWLNLFQIYYWYVLFMFLLIKKMYNLKCSMKGQWKLLYKLHISIFFFCINNKRKCIYNHENVKPFCLIQIN